MDIAVPSRFACLRIEDDDFKPANSNKATKKKQENKQQNKKQEKSAKQEPNKKNPSKPANNTDAGNKKSKKKQQPNPKQWEEWKKKDDQLVNGNFEQDLQNAILLSKLDYEEKKEIYQQVEKDTKKENQTGKKKKNKAMSLNQFLDKNSSGNTVNEKQSSNNKPQKQGDFFEKVKQEAKDALNKEEISHKRKKREANIEETITIAQYQAKLEKEIAKNAALQSELDKTKKEIAEVKARNKRLCSILGDGEMKDKADVLLELQRLNGVKNELTEEVSRLHGLLEQERSKVAALTTDPQQKHKDKKQKKAGSNNK